MYCVNRNWVLATNSNFLFPFSLLNNVNLKHFKNIWANIVYNSKYCKVVNIMVYGIVVQRYWDTNLSFWQELTSFPKNHKKIKKTLHVCVTQYLFFQIYFNKFKLHHLYMYLYLCMWINLNIIIICESKLSRLSPG